MLIEYKVEAFSLIVEEGRSISWNWRLSHRGEELRQLRIENMRLRMESDMLKQVVAIFSEEQ
jgi:hypothetical protein